MTDIKERAMKVLPPSEYIGEGARHYYIQGATEQDPISRADERKRVIERACILFEEAMYQAKRTGIHGIPQMVVRL